MYVIIKISIVKINKAISFQADLLGDEIISTPGAPANQPAASVQSNQDLLAEIFGSSIITDGVSPVPQQKSSHNDILGLFGNTGPASPAPQQPYSSATSSFSTPAPSYTPNQATSPPPPAAAPVAPAPQRYSSYPAYDKNDLKITLTPQTSPAKPGIVMILARFQVAGGETATGLSFQAAVPKV